MSDTAVVGDAAPPGDLIGTWQEPGTSMPAVLAALDRLRRDSAGSGTRAAVVNLIVLAAVDAAADRVVHSVTGLGGHHPGRTTVIVADPDGTTPAQPGFDARVELRSGGQDDSAAPWWEVVVLHVRGEVCRHLDSVVEPLLMHDLPVALWLAGGTSRVDSDRLVAAVDQVFISGERAASRRADDLDALASDLADLAARKPLADLTWLALGPGRMALARLLDNPKAADRRLGNVAISGPPWSARLLAAWLVERCVVEAQAVRIIDVRPNDDGHLRAEFDLDDEPASLDAGSVWPAGSVHPAVEADSPVAESRFGDICIGVPFPGADTPRLLTAALTRPGRDARYEAALSVAADWRR